MAETKDKEKNMQETVQEAEQEAMQETNEMNNNPENPEQEKAAQQPEETTTQPEETTPQPEETTAQPEEDVQPAAGEAGERVKASWEIREEREALEDEVRAEKEELKNRHKAIKRMRQIEAQQKRNERINSAKEMQEKFRSGAKEMSEDLKKLLSKDISVMERKKKSRGAEIWAIFAKHNFYMGGFNPVELRTTLEDLGPTFVKIGQIMSSRVDMLPESYCKELEKLRQNVKELDPEVARAIIEQETGKKIDEIYSEFDDKPIGSASIGQVHKAVLLDGTKVVTKVQRPLIADMMRNDFVLLKKAAGLLGTINEGKEDDSEQIDLLSVITELEKVTDEELDFRVEARNYVFFKENCIEDETKITCPTVFPELTTERMMAMTFVDGYSVAKRDRLIEDGYDPNAIGEVILDSYVHQVLDVGSFHADPHQGNIMVSHGLPYWIDFGMIGRLTPANIRMIQDLILSIIETDTEGLVNAAMAMGAASPKTDRAKLTEDLDAFIQRYMSVTNLADLDMAVLLGELTDLMSNHHIKIPGEYTMLIRSIATIEGVMEQLCPELNLFEKITDKLLERAKKSFDLQQTLVTAGKDALSLGKKAAKIPVLAADVLGNISKGRAKINMELTGYQDLMDQVTGNVRNLIYALFSCVLFFGSCLLCQTQIQPKTADGMPVIAVVGFIFSIALGIYTVRRMAQKK